MFTTLAFPFKCVFCTADSLTFTDERHSGPESAVTTPTSVEELLGGVQRLLSESLVRHVGASFQFEISSMNGEQHRYYLDLSQGESFLTVWFAFRERSLISTILQTLKHNKKKSNLQLHLEKQNRRIVIYYIKTPEQLKENQNTLDRDFWWSSHIFVVTVHVCTKNVKIGQNNTLYV